MAVPEARSLPPFPAGVGEGRTGCHHRAHPEAGSGWPGHAARAMVPLTVQVVGQVPAVAVLQESSHTPVSGRHTSSLARSPHRPSWALGAAPPPPGRWPHNPRSRRSAGCSPPLRHLPCYWVGCPKPTDTGQCGLPRPGDGSPSWRARPRPTARPAGTHLHDQVDRIGHFLGTEKRRERKGSASRPRLAAPGEPVSAVWPGHWAP